jgi:molybdenum cofactor guanylyltransferase
MTDGFRVLGVILAGGASRRFGADKRAALLAGRPLLEWAIERARPQVGTLLINANDRETAREFVDLELLADDAPGEGPIAGVLAGLKRATQGGFTHLASFACDTPFFPRETVSSLAKALRSSTADYAVASCGATAHRVFAFWPTACRAQIEHAFASGTRSMREIEHWLEPTWADFAPDDSPDGDPFFNINTADDLEVAEHWLVAQRDTTK